MQLAVLKINRLYILPSGSAIKILKLNEQRNICVIHNYGSKQNEIIEYNMAPKLLTPVLKIGEAAALFGKKADTLRKYERLGLIDKPTRYNISSKNTDTIRLYGPRDLRGLVRFFERRNPVGRPGSTNPPGINKELINNKLKVRYKE